MTAEPHTVESTPLKSESNAYRRTFVNAGDLNHTRFVDVPTGLRFVAGTGTRDAAALTTRSFEAQTHPEAAALYTDWVEQTLRRGFVELPPMLLLVHPDGTQRIRPPVVAELETERTGVRTRQPTKTIIDAIVAFNGFVKAQVESGCILTHPQLFTPPGEDYKRFDELADDSQDLARRFYCHRETPGVEYGLEERYEDGEVTLRMFQLETKLQGACLSLDHGVVTGLRAYSNSRLRGYAFAFDATGSISQLNLHSESGRAHWVACFAGTTLTIETEDGLNGDERRVGIWNEYDEENQVCKAYRSSGSIRSITFRRLDGTLEQRKEFDDEENASVLEFYSETGVLTQRQTNRAGETWRKREFYGDTQRTVQLFSGSGRLLSESNYRPDGTLSERTIVRDNGHTDIFTYNESGSPLTHETKEPADLSQYHDGTTNEGTVERTDDENRIVTVYSAPGTVDSVSYYRLPSSDNTLEQKLVFCEDGSKKTIFCDDTGTRRRVDMLAPHGALRRRWLRDDGRTLEAEGPINDSGRRQGRWELISSAGDSEVSWYRAGKVVDAPITASEIETLLVGDPSVESFCLLCQALETAFLDFRHEEVAKAMQAAVADWPAVVRESPPYWINKLTWYMHHEHPEVFPSEMLAVVSRLSMAEVFIHPTSHQSLQRGDSATQDLKMLRSELQRFYDRTPEQPQLLHLEWAHTEEGRARRDKLPGGTHRTSEDNTLHELGRWMEDADIEALLNADLCTHLRALNLRGNSNLRSLPGLHRLRRLRILDLSFCGLSALPQDLAALDDLTDLKVEYGELDDITVLKETTQLERLSLRMTGLRKTSEGFEHLTNLRHADLSDTALNNMAGVQDLGQLEYLNLSGCQEVLLDAGTSFHKLVGLRELHLTKCGPFFGETRLEVLNTMADLPNLEVLSLQMCKLTELPGAIQTLQALRVLDLSLNEDGMDISGLRNLPRLEDLDLSVSRIKLLPTEFATLTGLKKLDLTEHRLRNLDGLRGLLELEELTLRLWVENSRQTRGRLKALPPWFAELKSLRKLDLINNGRLQDIECLVDLPNLQELDLRGCKACNIPEALLDRGVNVLSGTGVFN
ncbi:MAG: leucine-rich repeat domain-containing protein [Nannocystaceae bacterium]|nr:leucine-rich repeat domain-containing protein [Nannocystaceae bacterium]